MCCDLLGPLSIRSRGAVGLLVFNPPYVPTDVGDSLNATSLSDLALSWAGGDEGADVISRVISQAEVTSATIYTGVNMITVHLADNPFIEWAVIHGDGTEEQDKQDSRVSISHVRVGKSSKLTQTYHGP